jgi:hypothetical protein
VTLYPLWRLLAVREHRVAAAAAEIARRRRLADEASADAEKTELAAREFAGRRPLEETALFERIRNRMLDTRKLELYHEARASLVEREDELFHLAGKAREKAAQAEAAVREAIRLHGTATRELQTMEKHRAIWQEAENRRLEAIEELEIEEAAGSMARRGGVSSSRRKENYG